MLTRSLWFYEARVAFGWPALIAALLLPACALFICITRADIAQRPDFTMFIALFERLIPLCAGLVASHLMSIEREERFDDIRRTYPEASWRLPLVRTIGTMLIITSAVISAILIFQLVYGPYIWADIVAPAIPPTLYLLALALLINNVSASYWITAGVIVMYWFTEYSTAGRYSGPLFLFHASAPVQDVDYGLNRVLLIGLGLAELAANMAYTVWRRTTGG